MVTIGDFAKIELKVGTILEAIEIEGSDRLLKLQVDLGEKLPRQVVSGIKQRYSPAKLIGKQAVFITNLQPRMMMGLSSNGMILAADGNKPVILKPLSKVPPGSKIK